MRVLLIAEAANPEWVSVPLVGWSHARALAKVCDVHLVTQIRNSGAIERAGLIPGRDFTAINSEKIAGLASRLGGKLRGGSGKGWTTLTAINAFAYPYFERLVWKQFGERIKGGEFDLVHRLTPLTPTASSSLAPKCRKAGVPFVLGPLNGGVAWPKAFDSARRKEKEWLSYVRGMYKLLPGYSSTRRNAAAILIASKDTWQQMPARYYDKCFYVPENAIDPARFPARQRSPIIDRPLRILFVGRLVPYKGADMLLESSVDLLKSGQIELTIVGNGPQLEELRKTIVEQSLPNVELTGWLDHTAVAARMADADILGFPSVREFGGGVVLEAMAVGTVPIIVNYGGPAELLTPDTGFAVPLGNRASIVQSLKQKLTELVADPSVLAAMSQAAHTCAIERFTWDAKAHDVLKIYRWVTGQGDKPRLGVPG